MIQCVSLKVVCLVKEQLSNLCLHDKIDIKQGWFELSSEFIMSLIEFNLLKFIIVCIRILTVADMQCVRMS